MLVGDRNAEQQGKPGWKKIAAEQLRLGMYIEDLCCSWLDTPFWHTAFLLDEAAQLEKIAASKVTQVWINTLKGLDVLGERAAAAPPAEPPAAAPPPAAPVFRFKAARPVSMDDELGRAGMVVTKSKQAVFDMFNEARMGRAVDVQNAMPLVEDIAASVMRNPGALIGLARLKNADNYTYMHSVAVCALMIALARQLKLDDAVTRELGLAGLLHDVGKMAVPLTILNKPGALTTEEFSTVRGHPEAGYRLLHDAPGMSAVALDVCLHHHERPDGKGYPQALSGEALSLHARMGSVCDVYDAITSTRPYKRGWCPAESLRRMAEWTKAGQFDDAVFAAFVHCLGIYPVGTLVRLKSGRLGVVVEQPVGASLLLPKVRVFFSAKSRGYIVPELLDLATPAARDSIVSREDAAEWGLADIDRYWLGDAAR